MQLTPVLIGSYAHTLTKHQWGQGERKDLFKLLIYLQHLLPKLVQVYTMEIGADLYSFFFLYIKFSAGVY